MEYILVAIIVREAINIINRAVNKVINRVIDKVANKVVDIMVVNKLVIRLIKGQGNYNWAHFKLIHSSTIGSVHRL